MTEVVRCKYSNITTEIHEFMTSAMCSKMKKNNEGFDKVKFWRAECTETETSWVTGLFVALTLMEALVILILIGFIVYLRSNISKANENNGTKSSISVIATKENDYEMIENDLYGETGTTHI
jgi:hypothetical protein